jgi:hypothetical protein
MHMWNPFASKTHSTQGKDTDLCVIGVAMQELVFGDARSVVYSTDGDDITSLRFIGLQSGAREHRSVGYEYVLRHVQDSGYSYGTFYSPVIDEGLCYEDMQAKGVGAHALLRVDSISSDYVSWIGVDSSVIAASHKDKSDQIIGNGYKGLYKLFGLGANDIFVYIVVERYETVVVLLVGPHVLGSVTVSVGTSQMVRTVADILACPTDMARSIIETHGVLDTHYDSKLRNRIIATYEPVLSAIEECVNNYDRSVYRPIFMRQSISSWAIGGSGASVPGLASLISRLIQSDQVIDIAKPYEKLIKELASGPSRHIIPRYYTVLGLAIAGA